MKIQFKAKKRKGLAGRTIKTRKQVINIQINDARLMWRQEWRKERHKLAKDSVARL